MKVLIKITRDILERSAKCREHYPRNCAIALAMRELFPNCCVGAFQIRFYDSTYNNRSMVVGVGPVGYANLPDLAIKFIRAFDSAPVGYRAQLPEFSFEVDIPNEVIDSIGIGQVYKVLSESKTLEHVN
jgi:hypothetical protein